MPRILKSRDTQTARSREMAEVFTPSWICNAQNNLIDEAWFGRKDVFNTEYTDEQIQEIKRQRDRRKRQQITVIVFILGVLFALVGILERGGAIYLVLGIACLLMGVMLLVDVLYGVIDPRIRLAKEE